MAQKITKYENSLIYQINSTSKYFDKLFEQIFKEMNFGITSTEHLALTVVNETADCCQRDLARIILKDRANTGKLAKTLEEKGFIKIELKTKNNRLVKILTTTKKGKKILEEIMQKFKPVIEKIEKEFSKKEVENIKKFLENFKTKVKKIVKTNI